MKRLELRKENLKHLLPRPSQSSVQKVPSGELFDRYLPLRSKIIWMKEVDSTVPSLAESFVRLFFLYGKSAADDVRKPVFRLFEPNRFEVAGDELRVR